MSYKIRQFKNNDSRKEKGSEAETSWKLSQHMGPLTV